MRRQRFKEGSSEQQSTEQEPEPEPEPEPEREPAVVSRLRDANRPAHVMLTIIAMIMFVSWSVYYNQYQVLPQPLTPEKAGKRGFSEFQAMKHVRALSLLGPHSVGSHSLDLALQVCCFILCFYY